MKYIIINTSGILHPITFQHSLSHASVAGSCLVALRELYGSGTIWSAGFCRITNDGIVCYGKSDSLNVSTRGAVDESVIELALEPKELIFEKDFI